MNMSRKMVLGLLATVVASVGTVTGSVNAESAKTAVTGVITDNHVAVSGARVAVLCNGHTRRDRTDAQGSYLVTFPKQQCPTGSTVKVTARMNGKSGVSTGTVQGITTKLNLAIVNVSIPEYGLIGAILAGGTGVGLIAHMRRRREQFQF